MRKTLCSKGDQGLKRGPWTTEEDQKLVAYIQQHGHGSWRFLPKKAGIQRCGKSCRLRWTNYLRPDIKRGKFSLDEEKSIIQLHALLGNRWSAIATHLPKRTDNEIKNYWNTHVKKRLAMLGIDPMTHKPSHETLGSNLSHMAQWERTRLEAEARLVRESKLVNGTNPNDINDSFKMMSSEKILKKMPTTFAPPRWNTLLFFANTFIQGNDHTKSDGSKSLISAGEFGGRDDLDYWNNLMDNNHNLNHHNCGAGNLIETSFGLVSDQVNKSGTYWSDILNFVNYWGPSN